MALRVCQVPPVRKSLYCAICIAVHPDVLGKDFYLTGESYAVSWAVGG